MTVAHILGVPWRRALAPAGAAILTGVAVVARAGVAAIIGRRR